MMVALVTATKPRRMISPMSSTPSPLKKNMTTKISRSPAIIHMLEQDEGVALWFSWDLVSDDFAILDLVVLAKDVG